MAKSFKNFQNPLVNADPEMENTSLVKLSVVTCSTQCWVLLRFLSTLYGNIAGTVFEPFNMMAGAMVRGDVKAIQDYWMAYTALVILGKSMQKFGKHVLQSCSERWRC